MEYNIHGGVNTVTGNVDWLEVHGGVVRLKGNVGTVVHTGGVIYDQRVEYKDRMSAKERDGYKRQIDELKRRLSKSEDECLILREKLGKEEAKIPSDDVLVARIESLQDELAKERAERKQEADYLKERLDVALTELNDYHRDYNDAIMYEAGVSVDDEMFDTLYTLINLYPFTTDGDLSFEFGITREQVKTIARILKLTKTKEARQEAADYLRRQHIELIQRRGGDQGNHNPSNCRAVERVSRNGRVTATYTSIAEAANHNGSTSKTIQRYCNSKKTIYTKDGVTFRFKKQ